ncbi:MAG: hypothetical protein J2P19_15750, partial [Pseudonocardia sp.]|nr:hypothetical protein [Pseudonocardia sp.]
MLLNGKEAVWHYGSGQRGSGSGQRVDGVDRRISDFAGDLRLAKLDVYTTLADRPLPINEIAEAVGADADILRRLIRTMAPMGLFRRLENDVVELTSKGGLLSR